MHDLQIIPVAPKRRRLGWLISFALSFAACSLPSSDAKLEASTATLVSAGDGAAELVHGASAGKYLLAIDVTIAAKGTRDGVARQVPTLPTLQFNLEVGPVTEERSGALRVKLELISVEAAAAGTTPAIAEAVKPLAKLKGHAIFAKHGGLVRLALGAPGRASGTTLQIFGVFQDAVERLFVPIPEQAFGQGGAFTVEEAASINGVGIARKRSFAVVDHKEGRAGLSFTETDTLPAAGVEVVPAGVPVELPIVVEALAGQGAGTVTLEAGAATAVALDFTVTSKTAIRVPQAGGEERVETETTATYAVTRRP